MCATDETLTHKLLWPVDVAKILTRYPLACENLGEHSGVVRFLCVWVPQSVCGVVGRQDDCSN